MGRIRRWDLTDQKYLVGQIRPYPSSSGRPPVHSVPIVPLLDFWTRAFQYRGPHLPLPAMICSAVEICSWTVSLCWFLCRGSAGFGMAGPALEHVNGQTTIQIWPFKFDRSNLTVQIWWFTFDRSNLDFVRRGGIVIPHSENITFVKTNVHHLQKEGIKATADRINIINSYFKEPQRMALKSLVGINDSSLLTLKNLTLDNPARGALITQFQNGMIH